MKSYGIQVTKSDIKPPTVTVKKSDIKPPTLTVKKSDIKPPTLRVNKSDIKPPTLRVNKRLPEPSRYQYYEAISDILRLKLQVKESTAIHFGTDTYSVQISLPEKLFEGNQVKETSRAMALLTPQWNETLSFLVKETDFVNKEKYMLDIQLNSTNPVSNSKTTRISMGKLCQESVAKFETETVHIFGKFDAERDVKFRNINQLCKKEQKFRTKRQEVVFKNMNKKLQVQNLSQVDYAPTIAIIGSGGGMRAVIGMCGTMTALQDIGILDSAMYIAGLSGSAWYILTLYAYDKQLKLKAVTDFIRKQLEPVKTIELQKYYTKGKVFNSGKSLTITDYFGKLIGGLLLEEKCKQKWSNQRKKLAGGSVPLPLISVLHCRDEDTIEKYNEWIELSPYEVFMPKYGVAIDMKNFGDRFYGGFITKEYGEQPIHFLQGMCGSAYAAVRNYKPPADCLSVLLSTANRMFNTFDTLFVGKVPSWLHGISEFRAVVDYVEPANQIFDVEKTEMMLVDAGIAFNSPYPTVMHPARKVDVIVSFDFSDRGEDKNWPFRELEKAQHWAFSRNIPFPDLSELDKIDDQTKTTGDYKEVYCFEGDNQTPTIIHFVMINKSYRKSCNMGDIACLTKRDFDILPKYNTLKFGYSNEDFDILKSLFEYNVYNNKKEIVEAIQKVIDRKKKIPPITIQQ